MKKKQGFVLLELVISICLLSIISTGILSVILNSYKYNENAKKNYNMVSAAKKQMELIKFYDYKYILENYNDKNIKLNGFNILTTVEDVHLNNCMKVNLNISDSTRKIQLSTYKVK